MSDLCTEGGTGAIPVAKNVKRRPVWIGRNMKKIISLFQRNYDIDRLVRNKITPGAEWVLDGEGVATRKWDGTCCLVRNGILYKRYNCKQGKAPPPGFEPAQDPDPITGHWPGWLQVSDHPSDVYFREVITKDLRDGTYELVGPKVNGNPEKAISHVLIKHGDEELDAPRTFPELRTYLEYRDIEGIVWHHPDGRMVKIKKKDFGFKR